MAFLGFTSFLLLSSSLQVTKSVISLLRYYGWKKFSIIYEGNWATVAKSLKQQAKKKNMTINHSEEVTNNHKCCENFMECCRSGYWYQVSPTFSEQMIQEKGRLNQSAFSVESIYFFWGTGRFMTSIDFSQYSNFYRFLILFNN